MFSHGKASIRDLPEYDDWHTLEIGAMARTSGLDQFEGRGARRSDCVDWAIWCSCEDNKARRGTGLRVVNMHHEVEGCMLLPLKRFVKSQSQSTPYAFSGGDPTDHTSLGSLKDSSL